MAGLLGQNDRAKRRVFISYYHWEDEYYRGYLESKFSPHFINKSVQPGDIDPDNSAEYIKRLVLDDYIRDASVVAVLVGPNTKNRKHVDWEISAGLNNKVGGRSGLLGILLPTFPLAQNGNYAYSDLPPRLAANAQSGFAPVYLWNWVTASPSNLISAFDDAFQRRVSKDDVADNSLALFAHNR